jgi:hypothetical protein
LLKLTRKYNRQKKEGKNKIKYSGLEREGLKARLRLIAAGIACEQVKMF